MLIYVSIHEYSIQPNSMCSILKYVVLSEIDQNNWHVISHSTIPILGEQANKEYRSHFKIT